MVHSSFAFLDSAALVIRETADAEMSGERGEHNTDCFVPYPEEKGTISRCVFAN